MKPSKERRFCISAGNQFPDEPPILLFLNRSITYEFLWSASVVLQQPYENHGVLLAPVNFVSFESSELSTAVLPKGGVQEFHDINVVTYPVVLGIARSLNVLVLVEPKWLMGTPFFDQREQLHPVLQKPSYLGRRVSLCQYLFDGTLTLILQC